MPGATSISLKPTYALVRCYNPSQISQETRINRRLSRLYRPCQEPTSPTLPAWPLPHLDPECHHIRQTRLSILYRKKLENQVQSSESFAGRTRFELPIPTEYHLRYLPSRSPPRHALLRIKRMTRGEHRVRSKHQYDAIKWISTTCTQPPQSTAS